MHHKSSIIALIAAATLAASASMASAKDKVKVGFIGPKPPAGQTHPYHFEVFALDTKLNLDPDNTDRTKVAEAMKGHVLAEAVLIGTYEKKKSR